ncbi:MAG: ribosome small subunit-dependent GTPase A [Actinomycetota bacterium]|nr:ribosome small subunit-dependent GTPase A [Actinomycetota bacterium]
MLNHSVISAELPTPGSLAAFGWNESVATRYLPYDEHGHHLVRIVRVDRESCVVATAAGVTNCRSGSSQLGPVTGDWAVARDTPDGGLILHELLPRTTMVLRGNATATGEQVLVANIDTMFILHGVDRPHRVGRLQRLAILSWEAGVHPVIVLTKIDLVGTEEAVIGIEDAITEINKVVHDIEVVSTSSLTGEGVDSLRPYLIAGHTVGLLGESGAGKSSLVNQLLDKVVQSTGDIRDGDHKGRHTTTSRDLVPIPGGAVLVDTPGLRSISMPAANAGLARAYTDLETFAEECRFRDCTHVVEPGCAIQAAMKDGELTPERWEGYQKLQREMSVEAERTAIRARQAESRTARRRRRVEPDADEW